MQYGILDSHMIWLSRNAEARNVRAAGADARCAPDDNHC